MLLRLLSFYLALVSWMQRYMVAGKSFPIVQKERAYKSRRLAIFVDELQLLVSRNCDIELTKVKCWINSQNAVVVRAIVQKASISASW